MWKFTENNYVYYIEYFVDRDDFVNASSLMKLGFASYVIDPHGDVIKRRSCKTIAEMVLDAYLDIKI